MRRRTQTGVNEILSVLKKLPDDDDDWDDDDDDCDAIPAHYDIPGLHQELIEVIQRIVEYNAKTAWEGACLKDVLKYLFRYRHKGGMDDLVKARVYLGWLLDEVELDEVEE